VVLTADHGEEFREHGGMTHGQTLYRELLSVPLLVRLPGGQRGGTARTDLVQQVDIMPTILEATGIRVLPGLDGVSVLHAAAGPGREVVSYLLHDGREIGAVTDAHWVFIQNLQGAEPPLEIYDAVADLWETSNLAGRDPVLTGYARQRLPEILEEDGGAGPTVDPTQLEQLRALGYVAG
jgi:arylsulfatase A-like enzyme